ncbi:hypothetical protein [Actinotalea subterranea]|uniref:hypothetical protein n=1 Tax=Actinotalea subterranea TaxID=2607497 RepID=UPI0011F082FB|nr:hypothetical protein [Actinotalea subterranea]
MARIYGYFEHPDDLTPGRSKEGGLHQNLYDSDRRLADHATFFPDDEELQPAHGSAAASGDGDDLTLEGLLGALVLLGAMAALETAKPHVVKWWGDQALPVLRSTWHRLATP